MELRDFGDGDLAEGIHGPSHDVHDRDSRGVSGRGSSRRSAPDGWQRTLVAEDADGVLGMGTMLVSNVHRNSYYCEIQVEPEARRMGVGRRLFEALVDCTPTAYPILTRAMTSQPGRIAFAEAMGFDVLMRCPSPQLHPAAPATRNWIDQHPVPGGVSVMPAGERRFDEFLDAWAELYVWIHEDWSPTVDRDTVRGLFAASGMADVDFELSQVAILDNQIVALACVLPDQWDNRSFLVTETVSRRLPGGVRILGATIAAALRACAARGINLVEFDGHEVDPHYYPLARTFPISGSDPLLVMRHPGRRQERTASRVLVSSRRRPAVTAEQLR